MIRNIYVAGDDSVTESHLKGIVQLVSTSGIIFTKKIYSTNKLEFQMYFFILNVKITSAINYSVFFNSSYKIIKYIVVNKILLARNFFKKIKHG